MLTHNIPSRDHAHHNLINLGHGSFECLNIRNDTSLTVFLAVCWVPELIIKAQEGLNLFNIEELYIGTVNLAKLVACSFQSADNLSFMDKGPL